jgi:hypothetical protein
MATAAKGTPARRGIAGVSSVLKQAETPIPFSFDMVGDRIAGVIEGAVTQPLTDPETKAIRKNYLTGQPIRQVVFIVRTDEGLKAFFVRGGVQEAVNKALAEAQLDDVAIGDYIECSFTGEGEPIREDWNPPKLYEATITPV